MNNVELAVAPLSPAPSPSVPASIAEPFLSVITLHPKGFGFARSPDAGPDVFLPAGALAGVLHGEQAWVAIDHVSHDGRRTGRVVEIPLSSPKLLGRLRHGEKRAEVVPLDGRNAPLLVDLPALVEHPLHPQNLVEGTIVQARLVHRASPESAATVWLEKQMGTEWTAEVASLLAYRSRGFSGFFPPDVLAEAKGFGNAISSADTANRQDLRHLPWVTIDGQSTRDFDDALVVEERNGGGWTLWVGIADVAHYVRPGSALDAAARTRGTSVYLPGKVLPMLPVTLSNGLCSLNPGKDRLALVAEMEFNQKGERIASRFHAATLRSHARLTYAQVSDWLKGSITGRVKKDRWSAPVQANVRCLEALWKALDSKRQQRFALDFGGNEPRLKLDPEGRVVDIAPEERTVAHRMVEEAMIAANVAVAEHLLEKGAPAPFRNHPLPCPRRFAVVVERNVSAPLLEVGVSLENIAHLLQQQPELAPFVRSSQVKATYSPENQGHFGLGLSTYAHFTSPIRRYPDLLVHRALWSVLCPEVEWAKDLESGQALAGVAEHLSEREGAAASAEREATDRLRLAWLQRQPSGLVWSGVVNGVTATGLFVTLDETGGSGFLPLPEGSQHKPERLSWEHEGQEWTLGTPIRVSIQSADPESSRLSLGWAAPAPCLKSSVR